MAETVTPFLTYLDAIKMREAKIEEMSEADMKRYAKYIASDLDLSSLAKVTKRQMDRIKVCFKNLSYSLKKSTKLLFCQQKKLRPEWFSDLMLKKTVTALTKEISDEHNFAIKTAVFDYLLMDEEERKRLNISQSRPRFRYFFILCFSSYAMQNW